MSKPPRKVDPRSIKWALVPFAFVAYNSWLFDQDFGWLEFCDIRLHRSEEIISDAIGKAPVGQP